MVRRIAAVTQEKDEIVPANTKKTRPESYTALCKRLRSGLTEIIGFIEKDCRGEASEYQEKRATLYGEKENTIGALTKAVSLLAKLEELEKGLKSPVSKTDGAVDEGVIDSQDLALLKRFLERQGAI